MLLPNSAGDIAVGKEGVGEEQEQATMNSFASVHVVGMCDPEIVKVTALELAGYTIGEISVMVAAKNECKKVRDRGKTQEQKPMVMLTGVAR